MLTHSSARPSDSRFSELDALRGLAALVVVVFHTTESIIEAFPGTPMPGPGWFWPWTPGGNGVSAFFMISGFVISLTLNHCRSWSDFAIARFLRLFPIFWVAMLFTTLWRQLVGGDSISLGAFAANITMLPSWLGQAYVDGVYWTLEIELQFYLLIAIIWRCGWMRHITPLCLGWFALAIVLKLSQQTWPDSVAVTLLWHGLLIPFAPYFGLGMLAYRMTQQRPTPLTWATVALGVLLTVATGNMVRAGVTGVMTLVLLALSHGYRWRVPASLVLLGEGSYCIYLFHQAYGGHIAQHLADLLPNAPLGVGVAVVVMCLGTAMAAHLWVERPLARLTRRWKTRPPPAMEMGRGASA